MLWYYSSGDDVFQVEVSFDNATDEFVIRFHGSGCGEHVERFKDEIALRTRLDRLEEELAAQHGERVGTPVLLKDRWKL